MHDEACVQFLQWVLPQLQMRWPGFRKVHGQVCKRIQRRMLHLHMDDVNQYRRYIEHRKDEWQVLDTMLRVTISRFYRDKMMFSFLEQNVLPSLAQQAIASGEERLNIWSVGSASGEEAYTLAILWRLQLQQQFSKLKLHILATDADAAMCARAEQASYQYGCIKNLPEEWRQQVFVQQGDNYVLKAEYREDCVFKVQDVRKTLPAEQFHLLLCRNLVLTYYATELQRTILERLKTVIKPGGALVIGIHESLPAGIEGFADWDEKLRIFKRMG